MSTNSTSHGTTAPSAWWIPMRIHQLILHHVRDVAVGRQNLVITGPKGVGKTQAIHWALDEFSKEEERRPEVQDGQAIPRNHLYYASGRADGRKTALRDLLGALGHRVSSAQSKHLSVRDFTEMAVQELRGPVDQRNIRIVCVDEADGIDASNLNDLRQVIDAAEHQQYPMGMILVGTGWVLRELKVNRELGQRFSVSIGFSPFDEKEMREALPELHPDLKTLSEDPGWNELVEHIFDTAQGSIRRLERLLTLADSFGNRKQSGIDEKAIRFALRSLA